MGGWRRCVERAIRDLPLLRTLTPEAGNVKQTATVVRNENVTTQLAVSGNTVTVGEGSSAFLDCAARHHCTSFGNGDANFIVRDSPEKKLTALKPFDAGEMPALPVRRPHNGQN